MNKITLCDGRITLINGDCLEIMPLIKPQTIDFLFADLPYGTTDARWDSIIPLDKLWLQLLRLGKDRIAYAFTARQPFTTTLIASQFALYHHKWVWNKKQTGNIALAKYMPLQIDEDIIVFGKTPHYTPQMRTGVMRTKGGRKSRNETVSGLTPEYTVINDQYFPVNIIEMANPRRNKMHPTQKPVELLEYLIKTYTQENDVVLDPTMGSGTTAVACRNTNRRCIGIEKDQAYFEIAIKRVTEE